jgi:acyl carrier protein
MEPNVKIREFIDSNLVVFNEEAKYSDSDNIFEMGFVNSLFAMKLLTYIEKEFNITVENNEMEIGNFSSVNNIMKLINKKTN